MKRLALFMIELTAGFALLIGGAAAAGQGLPRSAMLAYVTRINDDLNIDVMDLRTRKVTYVGSAKVFSGKSRYMWSWDGRLAFAGVQDGDRYLEIYVWDDKGLTNISQSAADNWSPVWSRDGRLAFISQRDVFPKIYVWDGATLTKISQDQWPDWSPMWKSDGRLVYLSFQSGLTLICVWDGTNVCNKFPNELNADSNSFEQSIDGRLAFESSPDEDNTEVYVWDGQELKMVSDSTGINIKPVWSRDGRLAFSGDQGGNNELYVWDGTKVAAISHIATFYETHVWSGDGRLAFVSDQDRNFEIYIWDGKGLTNISQSAADDVLPTWSADGRLAFTSYRDGNSEIYVWDGSSLTNITQSLNKNEEVLAWWTP